MVRVPFPLPDGHVLKGGHFSWDPESREDGTRYIYFCAPGENRMSSIQVSKNGAVKGPYIWDWDGDEDRPTLWPSLLNPDSWHGFMRCGALISC